MTSVSSRVDGLSTRVDGIISSLTMLGTDVTGLEAGLMAAQAELASITAALEGVVTSEELGLISNTLADLQEDVLRSYQNFFNIWLKFEQQFDTPLHFKELDQNKVTFFKQWLLEDRKYSINNVGRILSALKTICLDAQKNDIPTHPYVNFIKAISQSRQQKIIHTLSFQEIKKIERCTVPQHLENAKKWVIIGCWIGQRVSDLLTLTPEQIRPSKQKGIYVDICQQKTQKRVTVGVINPMAVELLTKDFPKKMYPSKFNKQLKEVLKLAGITQMVTAQKYNGKIKRKETGIFPKYAVIASHDLRRSFATNFYSKIPTPLLMNMTGHSRETTFLKYIGLEENRDSYADDFMRSVSLLEL